MASSYASGPHIGPFKHTNEGTITRYAVRANPNPLDPTAVTLAYGARELPKLRRLLGDEDLVVRQRAVTSLCDLLHKPENIVSAIEADMVAGLSHLLQDDSALARANAAEALGKIADHAVGKNAIAEQATLPDLAVLVDDRYIKVREAAHRAIRSMASTPEGAIVALECGLVPLLVEKVAIEEETLQVIGLQSLCSLIRQDTAEALQVGAVNVCTALLEHVLPEVRDLSAQCLMALSFPFPGKEAACEEGAVAALTALLGDDSTNVRTAAAGALMSITIYNRGKELFLQPGAVDLLLSLLDDSSYVVRLNAVKVMTNVAEHPQGRKQLQASVSRLRQLKEDDSTDDLLKRSVTKAIDVITFTL